MNFDVVPPGQGWQALRRPRSAWSPEDLSLISTALQTHAGLLDPVKDCVVGWLAARPVKWWAAFRGLPASPPTDPVGRFACARILLHFAPLARHGNVMVAAAIDAHLQAVPYQLHGTHWLRVEKELYVEWHLGRRAQRHGGQDPAPDQVQILSLRLIDHALDTYRPEATQANPDRWVSEILKNIKIDEQRKGQVKVRRFEPMSTEEMQKHPHEPSRSLEEEMDHAQAQALVPQMGKAGNERSQQMTQGFIQALGDLSDNQIRVIYLTLFLPEDQDRGIAEALGTSVSNVRKRRHDALKRLRMALKPRRTQLH